MATNQLNPGTIYTNVAPNNVVTSTNLDDMVGKGGLLNGAVINQTGIARPTADADTVLLGDSTQPDTAVPLKVTLPNLAPEKVRTQTQVYAKASGSANPATVYTITLSPVSTAYNPGMVVRFRADQPCAAGAQINVNAIGAVNLLKYGGTSLNQSDIIAGQVVDCIYDDVTTAFQIISPIASTAVAAIQAASRNLIVTNDAGTPGTKMDITADAVMLLDTSNNSYLARSVSLVINIAASGANGLDTGSPANSTWYYLWVIYNSSTNTVAGLISTNNTSPTMPSGYAFKALVGAIYRNSGTNFSWSYQEDRTVWLAETLLFTGRVAAAANAWELYSSGTNSGGTGSPVNLNAVVPPIAIRMTGFFGSPTGLSAMMQVSADANGVGAQMVNNSATSGGPYIGYATGTNYNIPLRTAQTFYWHCVDTAARNRLSVTGYAI